MKNRLLRIETLETRQLLAVCGGSAVAAEPEFTATSFPAATAADHEIASVQDLSVFDIDGDGFIGPGEFSYMSHSWFSSEGDENWNLLCDYDGDGFIGPGDYSILSENWLKSINDAPELSGIAITGYTGEYDGASHGVSLSGLESGDTVLYSMDGTNYGAGDCSIKFGNTRIYAKVNRPGYKDWVGFADVVIVAKNLTISGTTVADKVFDGTTTAVITVGTVEGVVAGETIHVVASGSFPSSAEGDYTVEVSYSFFDENNQVVDHYVADKDEIPASISTLSSYTYTASANGSPGGTGFNAVTTTAITLTFTGDDIPSSIPLSDLVVGGDAVTTATSAISVSGNKAIIPIRVTKTEGASSYSANVTLDSGNTDTGVKQVPIYFVPCYWGNYPCQLGGSVTPSATQILEMENQNVILGPKFTNGVPLTFALNEDNWDKEVLLNGITGEQADFDEWGCGYSFFINSWGVGKSGVASFVNPSGDNQLPAFNDFTVMINGVQYSGIVTAACEGPSGTTPYTITLR